MKTPFSFGQFLIFSLSILLISSCGKAPEKQTPRQVEVEVDLAEIKGRAHPRVLDYAPSFRLQDQTGSSFSSEALADKPWVANFIFTRCPATCPRQTALLKTLQDQLAQDQELGQVHLLSFTVDPGHDTPEVLKNYAEEAGADESIWKFLTGSEKQIRDTVSRQGFKLAVEADPDDPSSITHSPYFILVDAYQRVRGLYDTGEATVLGELISDLKALQAEVVMVPGDADNPEWLSARAQKQRASASTLEAFHDFTFTDRREESGIRFRHKIVD
ncbi:MAG: SCO family protein, partial [Verrucomicrobiales bacterium]|nr:SCO family protein [Verrucomicrobiales bacterium]